MDIRRGGPRTPRETQGFCMAEGCLGEMWARNLCNKHYLKLYFSQQPRNTYERGRRWFRRTSLVGEVSEVAELTTRQSRKIVNIILKVIAQALKSGESVSIPGFGTFSPVPPRPFRYPYTFTPAKELREMINHDNQRT